MTTESAARACDFGGSIEEMDPSIGELVGIQAWTPTTHAPRALMSPSPYTPEQLGWCVIVYVELVGFVMVEEHNP